MGQEIRKSSPAIFFLVHMLLAKEVMAGESTSKMVLSLTCLSETAGRLSSAVCFSE
jgi:hypothetical protein